MHHGSEYLHASIYVSAWMWWPQVWPLTFTRRGLQADEHLLYHRVFYLAMSRKAYWMPLANHPYDILLYLLSKIEKYIVKFAI